MHHECVINYPPPVNAFPGMIINANNGNSYTLAGAMTLYELQDNLTCRVINIPLFASNNYITDLMRFMP